MTHFKCGDDVSTPRGPGSFIGYMADGYEAQVAIKNTRGGKHIVTNQIFPLGDITELINAENPHRRRKAKMQVTEDVPA